MARETAKARKARLALEVQEVEDAQQDEDDNELTFSEGDELTVDLNAIEDVNFEIMPRGKYGCQITECEFGISNSGGNPMWSMVMEVEEGEFAERTLFLHWVWAGKGIGYTKRQAARIAPELMEEGYTFDPQDEEVIESMIGKRLMARVTTKKYEGEMRNNVADVFAPADGGGFLE